MWKYMCFSNASCIDILGQMEEKYQWQSKQWFAAAPLSPCCSLSPLCELSSGANHFSVCMCVPVSSVQCGQQLTPVFLKYLLHWSQLLLDSTLKARIRIAQGLTGSVFPGFQRLHTGLHWGKKVKWECPYCLNKNLPPNY